MKIKTALFLVFAFFATTAFQTPVPVANEAHHHVKFENKYVRVYDVIVPPGDETLYHVHANDYVFVTIGDAALKAQTPGAQQTDLILKDAEVRFTKATITHRIINVAKTPFHNLTVEILASPGIKEDADSQKDVPGRSIVLENDRIRVARLVLEPGQSTGMHTHSLMSLSVVVTTSKIAFDTPGNPQQITYFQPGVFNWNGEKRIHSLKNVGTTRFEVLEVEWK